MGALRIYIKQTDLFDINGNPVHYAGANPATLNVTQGQIPPNRRWASFGTFQDVTSDFSNLDDISLTWTEDRDASGAIASGEFLTKKAVSGSLIAEGESYTLIKKWLIDDVSATLNKVDVKIHDIGCNKWFEGYQISNEDLIYCEGEICQFDIVMRQEDANLTCLRNTMIYDNWQNWFPPDGNFAGKLHPRFPYCNEIRPNGSLVATWKLGTFNFMLTNTILVPFMIGANGIFAVINAIIAVINFLGGNIPTLRYLDPRDALATQEETFVESAGCGRDHPAPLIRDYIKNVCDKCGIKVDADTAPIFFNAARAVPFTSSGTEPMVNFHYNDCYFNAPVKRGIRRSTQPSPFLSPDFNYTNFWIDANRPIRTGASFLDELKPLYNAEWRVVNNTLYFQRKDFFINAGYVFDFGKNGVDRNKILQGVCFEWNSKKYPAYTQGLYANDPSDKCGNEALSNMNDYVSHGSTRNNPNIEGVQDKTVQFGGTRFRLDGITPDYICDAAQQNQNGGIFSSIFPIMKNVLDRFNDYELLLNEETASLPKILCWDGGSYLNARCVRTWGATPFVPGFAQPSMNTKYNTTQQWVDKHEANTFVKGQNFNLGSFPPGFYTVRNFYTNLTYQRPALLVNYPMYMDADFEGTMWDLFHFIDDPVKFAKAQRIATVRIGLCCEDIERLGLDKDGSNIALGQKIKVDDLYYPDVKIKEITLAYSPENDFGAHIEIKAE